MASGASANRFGPLSGPMADPSTTEIAISASGRAAIFKGARRELLPLAPHQLKAIVQRLARDIGQDLSAGPILAQGMLASEGFRVVMAGPGADALSVRLCRPARASRSEPIDVPAINDALDRGRSLVITGGGSIATVLLDLMQGRKGSRMAAINMPSSEIVQECDAVMIPLDLPIQAAVDLGAELLLVDELPLDRWYELLLVSCPFVATLAAKDGDTALRRLQTALLLSRPGMPTAAVDQAIANSIGLFVEVEGESVLSVMEPVQSATLTRAALGAQARVASAAAEGDEDMSDLPVGRVSREQLSLIRPEQLVSQSFLVDVSGVSDDTGIREWTDDGPEPIDRATDDLDVKTATSAPPRRRPEDETLPPPGGGATEASLPRITDVGALDKATKAEKKRKRSRAPG